MALNAVTALVLLFALASAQTTMKRCKNYYDAGQKINGMYDLEIYPRVIWRLYCDGMTTGKPKEYIDLPKKGAGNYARYYQYQGRGDTCADLLPRKDWAKAGTTQFTRVAIDLDTMLIDTSDFTFSTSINGKQKIPYGQAGDMYYSMRAQKCQKGQFKIDLTGTPVEIDPSVMWSWRGVMNNSLPNTNDITISSSPRQTVTAKCGGYPGECFPALSSAKTVPKLRLRVVPTHTCIDPNTDNPCKNYGKCVLTDAKASRCSCLPGWSGATCDTTTAPTIVNGPKSRKADDATSTAKCAAGYTLVGCKCSLANCDGIDIWGTNQNCRATNAGSWAGQVQAVATCSKYNSSLVQSVAARVPSSGWSLPNGLASFTCPTGYSMVICGWRSPWYNGGRSKYGQGTIAGNKCSIDCKRTGSKACALYAKCIKFNCLCENGGTCSGYSGHCICPEGYVGDRCENFDYCAWQFHKTGSPACQSGGTCQTIPANVIGTTGGDGAGRDCIFPFGWDGKQYGSCIANNTVGPPFACGAYLTGSRDYIDLGGWTPGVEFTLEGWVMPTVHVNGRRTIFGGADACRDWAVSMYNGYFAMAVRPPSGCSATDRFSSVQKQKPSLNQWHYIALTCDGNYMTLFVNGSKVGTRQVLTKSIGSARSFRVGGEVCCGNNNFGGYVKNLRVWKRSIGAAELLTMYKKPLDPAFNVTDNVLRRHLVAAYEFGDPTPPACHGKDWGYKDWYPADGDVVSGVHCNVKNFIVRQGVKVTVQAWKRKAGSNTGTGGTFEVYAQHILVAGELSARGSGYQGGARPTAVKQSGKQGESFTSAGGSTSTGEKSGGGGGGIGDTRSRSYGKAGGGGGHGSNGNNAFDRRNNQAGVGIGGKAYGTQDLHILHLGGGGGSGGNDNALNDNPMGGKGGNGGGAIHLDARNSLTVTGVVSADGDSGQGDAKSSCGASFSCNTRSNTICWDWSGPGGGGAGGSIYLRGLSVDIGANRVSAAGGKGGYGGSGCGGAGGQGRIRIDSDKLVGGTNPAPYKVKFNNTFTDLAQHARETLPLSQISSATDQSVYLGCYEDASHRGLQYSVGSTDTMTPDKCRQSCYAKGYKYYGLEWYGECFCDNDIGKYAKKNEGDCNTPCNGDKSRMCGGGWRLSIYGPKPKTPAVAMVNAARKCQPWCRNGWSKLTKQRLYGICVGDGHVTGWDIKCTCPLGFNGTRCESTCPSGTYGALCVKKCNCNNGASCDPATGACDCPAGWKGKTCSTPCDVSEFGPGCTAPCQCATHCTPSSCPGNTKFMMEAEDGTLGNQKSGIVINNGTASGSKIIKVVGASQYTASRSTIIATYTIAVTIPGDYYVWLRVVAPDGRSDSVYVSYNNKAKIYFNLGRTYVWTWKKLGRALSLPKGNILVKVWIRESNVLIDQVFVGQYRAASVCDPVDGTCTCEPGYQGLYCDQACALGSYGQDCTSKCTCSANSVCDSRDGHCLCFAGYQGANCDTKCTGNTFGTGCNRQCTCSQHSTCRHTDGVCLCDPGYTGPTCDLLCPAGRYGQNCSKACQCRQSASCDPLSGKCLCPPGYTGNDCGQACPLNYYGVDCKQKCNCNAASGTCDHVTGKCVCKPGYQGANCNGQCSAGKCGVGCKRNCPCGRGTCVKDDCTCRCWSGWQGANCNTACGAGLYGSNCVNKCSCIHGTCNRWTGKCTCQNGWKGASCDAPCASNTFGKNCASQCKCTAAYTTSCDPVTGACTCKSGYAGLFCETACPAGQHGQDCLGKCGCLNGGVCHNVQGTCDCPRGYYGAKCDHVCGAGTYGYLCASKCQCQNGASCDPVDGSCSCPAGYTGDLCDAPCPSGQWGANCNNSCSLCVQGTCDQVTGKCTCGDGWMGAACDQPCPSGKYGAGCLLTCNCVNGACDNVDGLCTCDLGFKGADCSVACDVGTYGVGCQSVCSRQCNNAYAGCDPVDGHCNCKPGYSGPWCNVTCPFGKYGANCAMNCPSCQHPTLNLACHPVTGLCLCSAGYVGEKCDMPCNDGTWGVNCTEQCSCPPVRATCSAVDGSCTCQAGYRGDACDQTCLTGFYGVGCTQSCPPCDSRYGYCSPQTGVCQCNPGYSGADCKTPCSSDKYGPNCAEDCTCLFGTCVAATGRCTCYHGYTGKDCDQSCTNNTYGVDCSHVCSCQNGGTCDPHTGLCYCPPGYYGHDCESACEDGYYGHLCGRKCECQNDADCDISTGFCSCKAGYSGLQCDMDCPAGLFGVGCTGACGVCANGVCSQITGECLCDPGWDGANCTKSCQKGSYGLNCATPCPDCYKGYTCSPTTGHCLCGGVEGFCGENGVCSTGGKCECDAGFSGEDCSSSCPTGSFGYNCSSECTCDAASTCSAADGSCSCPEGRWGSRCSLECECSGFCDQDTGTCVDGESDASTGGSVSTTVIIVVAVCCVLGGVLIAIVVFVYLRHKAKKGEDEGAEINTSGNVVKFDRHADDVGFSNPIYSTSNEPVKANPIYRSKEDQLDQDEGDDYTAPY